MLPAGRDLDRLLAAMEPRLLPGAWVFVTVDDPASLMPAVKASVREPEGWSVVVARGDADRLGLAYDFVAAWLILEVHSALDAVGLTAAVSGRLAQAGISANVIAGHHHDHVLVPVARAEDAVTVLEELAGRRPAAPPRP